MAKIDAALARAAAPPGLGGRVIAWALLAMIVVVAMACVALVMSAMQSAEAASQAARAAERAASLASCQGLTYPGAKPGHDVCGNATGSIYMSGMEITAAPVERFKLSPGRKELCSTVTLRNSSGEQRPYGSDDFDVASPTGVILTDSAVGLAGDLGSGVLKDGQQVTGKICTRFTGEAGQYALIYDPGPVTETRGIWITYVG